MSRLDLEVAWPRSDDRETLALLDRAYTDDREAFEQVCEGAEGAGSCGLVALDLVVVALGIEALRPGAVPRA